MGENKESIKFNLDTQLNFMFSTFSPVFCCLSTRGLDVSSRFSSFLIQVWGFFTFLTILAYCAASELNWFDDSMFDWKIIIFPFFQLHCLDWWFWVSWKRRNGNTGTKVPKAKLWSTSIIGWFRPTQRIWCWKGWKSVPYWSGQANSFSSRSVSGSKIGRISWIWTNQRSKGQ